MTGRAAGSNPVNARASAAGTDATEPVSWNFPKQLGLNTGSSPAASSRCRISSTQVRMWPFLQLDDTSSQLPLKFHLLTRGAGVPYDLDNIEVYTNRNHLSGGPVSVNALTCVLAGN
jgi:hypothetical protein